MDMNTVSFPYTHPADPAWLAAAVKTGYTGDTIDRTGCQQIADETNTRLPRWLMKDLTRRVGRGKYAVPELQLFAAQQKENA